MNVIVQFAKVQTSHPTSLASLTQILTLSAVLFVVFCGLSETGTVIATGRRDYAEMSTNERRDLGKEEGRVMEGGKSSSSEIKMIMTSNKAVQIVSSDSK